MKDKLQGSAKSHHRLAGTKKAKKVLQKLVVIQKEKNGILNHHEVVETYRFRPEVSELNEHIFYHWKATIVDLKKFRSKPFNKLQTDKEKWIYILNDAPSLKKEERDALKKDPVFQRALERLEMLSADPTTRKAYETSVNEQGNRS